MILAIGDVMLDVLLLPMLVREEQGSGVVVRGGGSAANTAAWCAAQGEPAVFAGCVGDDAVGSLLLDQLTRAGVDHRAYPVSGQESGCVAVEITSSGERVMRSSRGANQMLRAADVMALRDLRPDAVHVTGYSVLGEGGCAILEAAAWVARNAGSLLSFDASSAGAIRHVGADRLLALLQEVQVDVLLPNAIEAAELTGEETALASARALGNLVPTVLVKDGENGAAYRQRRESGAVPTRPETPLDTTGAGDAFNAGALCALVKGLPAEEACRAGHALASRAICRYGGRPE